MLLFKIGGQIDKIEEASKKFFANFLKSKTLPVPLLSVCVRACV